MSSLVIAGAQWGDEGKGKIVDVLTEQADVVARFQGGHNAGHTVVVGDTQFILHILPSGILHSDKLSIIGNGTVVDPNNMISEIDELIGRNITIGDNLKLSNSAHLIMPYHVALDGANEQKLGAGKIGTTKRGIGPCYADKMSRQGIKVGDLLYPEAFRAKLSSNLDFTNQVLDKIYGLSTFSVDEIYDEYMRCAERLIPFIADTDILINDALEAGRNVLFEGAQGTLLDIDHGTYPFVTSSSATVGGVCIGLGVAPSRIDKALGIVKAYTTRVGEGPFPTELHDSTGQGLRDRGGEFGATTGRARRCGWFDAIAGRYSCRINGFTEVAITRLDVLDILPRLKICVGYRLDGQDIDYFPANIAAVEKCEPVYEELEGWLSPTSDIREFQQLPLKARQYVERLEELISCRAGIISVGADREQTIIRPQTAR